MTYKLSPQLRLIKAPVILVVEENERQYGSGEELTRLTFDKNYIIDSISARDSEIVVTIKVNERNFSINWIGEEEVSFM